MNIKTDIIKSNYTDILKRVSNACRESGRSLDEITIIAVTKTVGLEEIDILTSIGIVNFGENRIQDAEKKIPLCRTNSPENWHMIGHLQANKAKKAVKMFGTIHSVDSINLAAVINAEAAKAGLKVSVLIQANTSREPSKHGIRPENMPDFMQQILKFDRLIIRGLMTMGPLTPDPEDARPCFMELRNCFNKIKNSLPDGNSFECLSMGMSHDYEIAIQEGATMLRIGTAFFKGLN
ncbi:MAG: YggS family pyridoxal phosphate-dependent enzyme [Planctomycetes bacterium]|nr:YggS family pyridoxal phosphate-dependent enzyme [Planctomycetota bacterium]